MLHNPLVPAPAPSFLARMAALLAATDQAVSWWGDHRAWPANEAARIADTAPRKH